jgi:uridine phosphorylase
MGQSMFRNENMFTPQHINATRKDLEGNHGIGRYVFITGSDQRAKQISQHFQHVEVRSHNRQHNLYLGTLDTSHGTIDVVSVSSGMGGSSADIIINELFLLGAKRILRIGTAGSLQPGHVHVGDLILVSAAVRDDKASWDYIYPEYPAISSMEYLVAAMRATHEITMSGTLHRGIVHSKSSFYAREMGFSFLDANKQYMRDLKRAGVVASEMECAQLFILTSLVNAHSKKHHVLAGAILAVVGDVAPFSDDVKAIDQGIDAAIQLGLETTRQMSLIDKGILGLY